jgi:hypothetical protein
MARDEGARGTRWRAGLIVGLVSTSVVVAVLTSGSDPPEEAAASTASSNPATVAPSSTSTTSASPQPIWTGDVETGDTSQWNSVAISGKADVEVVSDTVHGGRYALRLDNNDVDGTHSPGVRLDLQGPFGEDPKNLPDAAFYSAWYLIPFRIDGHSNIFQFKQSDVTAWDRDGNPTDHTRRNLWKLSTVPSEDGTTDLDVWSRLDPVTGAWHSEPDRLGLLDVDLPIGTWFHLEVYYRFGQEGRTTVWLDGVQVWDWSGPTEASDLVCLHRCREWVISHYLGEWQGAVEPRNSWIFVDDAAVSRVRLDTGTP